jgi:hypothetical protein
MVGLNKKALALNFVVVSAISLVVLVVIITIFVASVDKHDENLNDKSKTLFYCQCVQTHFKEDFCEVGTCRDLDYLIATECEDATKFSYNEKIDDKCGKYVE